MPQDVEKNSQIPGARGFTLLEILVSMAVLSVVLIAVYRLHAQSITATRTAQFQAVAPLLARQKLAELEIFGLDRLSADNGDFGEHHPGFTWQVEVEGVASQWLGEVGENLRQIDLTISSADAFIYRVRTYRFFQQ